MGFGGFGGPAAEMQKSIQRNKSQLNKRNSLKENLDSNKDYGVTPIKMKEF